MVTRVAFTADSQVDERSRFEEHARVMEFIVDDAEERKCCLLLHGGDLFERRSTERERGSVASWISAARNRGMRVAIVGGNHEAEGEVVEASYGFGDEVEAHERPRVCRFREGVVVAFLPWPRRASLRAWIASRTGAEPSIEDTDATAREMLRDLLRGFAVQFRQFPADMPRILLAHVEIDGYVTDSDQPACGGGVRVSVEDLMLAEADVVLCGHVHRPQHWTGRRADGVEVPVIYAGSPRRTSYAKGELVEKRYVIVTFDGRAVTWESVPTPATAMRLVELAWLPSGVFDGGSDALLAWAPQGAEIRLRYSVPSDARAVARSHAEALAAAWRGMGAAEVRIEEIVLPSTRARSPEIAAATSVREKLGLVLAARGVEGERAERVLAAAGEIEEAVR